MLDLAVWAPNHRVNEPWRFYVLDGAALAAVGRIARQITYAKIIEVGGGAEVAARKADEAAVTWASVPALLYVTAQIDPNPEIEWENYGAVCCAIQNFMLAAHAGGLATSWSSGAVAQASALRELTGATDHERMVGLIRAGFPGPGGAYARWPAHTGVGLCNLGGRKFWGRWFAAPLNNGDDAIAAAGTGTSRVVLAAPLSAGSP